MVDVVRNKNVIFKHYVNGYANASDMEVTSDATIYLELPKNEGVVILSKNLYFSCGPYMRNHMKKSMEGSYIDSFTPGLLISGYEVARILDSTHPDFKKGDLVWGLVNSEEYRLINNTQSLITIQNSHVPLSYYTRILGMGGLTAYASSHEICLPKKEDIVFVSAASGAVGQLVGQFVKLYGCYVVGSAGSKEMVDLFKNKHGFDEAFNYKEEEDLDAALKRHFPNGVDFENAGGKMLDEVLRNMRLHSRIAVCRMISQYNLDQRDGTYIIPFLILKCIRMEGFLVFDHYHLYPKFLEIVLHLIQEGKIAYVEDNVEGLENGRQPWSTCLLGKMLENKLLP